MNFNAAGWRTEIQGCTDVLTGAAVGARRDEITGFRSPFGQYNAALFPVLKELGFWYDCSIDEGHQPDQDGTNYFWPYTLDNGSPGHAARPSLPPDPDLAQGPLGDADLRAAGAARQRSGPSTASPPGLHSEDRQQRQDHRHGLEPVVRRSG